MSLDRFSQAMPWENEKPEAEEKTAEDKIQDFREELEDLMIKHDMTLKVKAPNLIIVYEGDGTEEVF